MVDKSDVKLIAIDYEPKGSWNANESASISYGFAVSLVTTGQLIYKAVTFGKETTVPFRPYGDKPVYHRRFLNLNHSPAIRSFMVGTFSGLSLGGLIVDISS